MRLRNAMSVQCLIKKQMKNSLALGIVACTFSGNCLAFPSKVYDYDGKDKQLVVDIMKTIGDADLVLECYDVDTLWQLTPDRNHIFHRLTSPDGQPTDFTRKGLTDGLISKTQKNLLVIWLKGNVTGKGSTHIQKLAKNLEPMGSALGFKRFLILGLTQYGHGPDQHGVQIFKDNIRP